MWLSSWASTPSSSTRLSFSSSPVVTAIGGVLRVAAGGEGVRRRVVDDVEARLGEAAGDAEALDEVVEPAVLLDGRRASPAHPQRDGVGLPVGDGRRRRPRARSAKTMKYGPAADEQVERGADRQHEADEGEDQEVGAALVLSDLVVHAGVRVLGGSETSVRRWGAAGGAGGGVGRRAAGAAEVDRRARCRSRPRRCRGTPRRPRSTRARRS